MLTFRFGLLFSAILLASSANGETLGDIYRLAVENDHDYLAAQAEYKAGLQDKTIGRAGILPNISAGYTWSDDEVESSDPTRSSDSTNSGYRIELTQPLFDLTAWHEYKRLDASSKIAFANYQTEQQQLIIRVADAYFEVLRSTDLFTSAKAEEDAAKSQLDQTKKRFEVGLTAITDVHEAQAAYDTARARRLLFEGNVGIAFEALEVITGQATTVVSPLSESFPIVPPEPAARFEWEKFAAENNFSLEAAKLAAELASQAAKQARGLHAPKVTASLSYSDGTSEPNNMPTPVEIDTETTSASITVSMPLFAGGSVNASRKKAYQSYYAQQERYNKTKRDTTQQARSLHLTVLTDVATVKARQQAITSSRSAYEATQAGYEVGTRDLVDVLNAQRALYAAQSNYSDALYTYVVNTLRLKAVAGLLSEKDIMELDKYLDKARQVVRDSTPLAYK